MEYWNDGSKRSFAQFLLLRDPGFHHSISLLVADKAGIVLLIARLCMTIGTVIHLHAVPGIALIPRNISTPDVDTVAGQAVLLVLWHPFALSVITVADLTLHISHFHVGDVGEIYAIRLSRIDKPGDFRLIGHIFRQEYFLIRALCHGGIRVVVTRHAAFQFGYARKSSIFPKLVAKEALLKVRIPFDGIYSFWIHMHGVAEIEGLWML